MDNLQQRPTVDSTATDPDERLTPLVAETRPDQTAATMPPLSIDGLSTREPADGVAVGEGLVTESLDAILLALIASVADETHGTGLMEALVSGFDAELSPGTVYPRLHALEEDGILEMHELVQTKRYSIQDDSATADRIEQAAREHLAMAQFLLGSLDAM
jgi:hypothetical protein